MKTYAVGPLPGLAVELNHLHPISHGGFLIHIESDDEVISSAKLEIGFVHRSAEKLMEVRDYRQGPMLANRHIWTAPTAGEYAYVLAAEELLGLMVSPRADLLRLIYCEIDRTLSHLAFLAPVLATTGISPAREALADFMAHATGSRMHHQVIRVGGVAADIEVQRAEQLRMLLDPVSADLDAMNISPLIDEYRGLAAVSSDVINGYGVTGPIARASGVGRDERQRSYGGYSDFMPVVGSDGDAAARLELLIGEARQSVAMITQALDQLSTTNGELLLRTPKNLRLPEGESMCFVEGALGSNGVSLFSTGGLAPSRLRLRTASFANLAALESVLVGVSERDLGRVLASWPALAGDADR